MANDRVMSGTGERAKENTPAVVTAINPAVNTIQTLNEEKDHQESQNRALLLANQSRETTRTPDGSR